MPKNSRRLLLERLQGRVGDVAYQLTKVHFSLLAPAHRWTPAINAYHCAKCLRICVDLAGVDRDDLHIEVAPGTLTLRGRRELPEPTSDHGRPMKVLAMEIDHGAFQREVPLPLSVKPDEVHAEQCNGLLWISLPLRHHA